MTGRSIRLFLPDGTPGSLFTAEIVNWTGRVTVFPRSELGRFVDREEAQRPGIYLLVGQNPERLERSLAYVGESESLGTRLRQHDQADEREFWEATYAISSKDENLTKSHVRYLETRLIMVLQETGRADLANTKLLTTSKLPPLPEADRSDMEYFLAQLVMLLPVVGFDGTRPTLSSQAKSSAAVPPTTTMPVVSPPALSPTAFVLNTSGLLAHAVEAGDEFIVRQGSVLRRQEGENWTSYRELRRALVEQGVIGDGPDASLLVFKQDVPFKSPSAASAVILGRNDNGRLSWKREGSGQTYKEWKEQGLSAVTDPER